VSEEIKYGTEFLDNLKDHVHDLYDENQQLKADLQEANDNATWWQNRFKSEHMQNKELQTKIDEITEYLKNQLEYLDFEKDIKARMLGSMVLVFLDKESK
jgi:peptidoglycan hydrolase CwlO-like protein